MTGTIPPEPEPLVLAADEFAAVKTVAEMALAQPLLAEALERALDRAEAAEAKVALIAEFCRDESSFLNTGTAGVAIVRAVDILAIIGSKEETA